MRPDSPSPAPRWDYVTQLYYGSELVHCPRCDVPAPEPCWGPDLHVRSISPHWERTWAARDAGKLCRCAPRHLIIKADGVEFRDCGAEEGHAEWSQEPENGS